MCPIPTFTKLGPQPEFNDLVNKINTLVSELQNLMLGVDSVNIFEAGGWLVTSDQLASQAGDVGMSTTATGADDVRLWAGSTNKDTAPWRVTESGKMTATGALIQSADSSYPRVVMDPDTDLFAAYASAAEFIKVFASETGVPSLYFENASNTARIKLAGSLFSIGAFASLLLSSTGNLEISTTNAGTDITLSPADKVIVPSWSTIFSTGALITLQQALDTKATVGASTSTAGAQSLNGGIPVGTVLMVDGGGTVTWNGISFSGHTHTQN